MNLGLSFTDKQIKALDLKIKLVPDSIKLVEQIRVGQSHPLYEECLRVCHLSKNLYNYALFKVKSQYKENKTILNYETLSKIIKNESDFKALPAKVSQQTLKLLQQNLNSFFGSLKSSNINHKVGFLNYYPSNKFQDDGLCVTTYTSQAISSKFFKENGLISLSRTDIKFSSSKIKSFSDIQQVRIVPHSKHIEKNFYFTLEIIYNFHLDKEKLGYKNNFFHHIETKILEYKTDKDGKFILNKKGEKVPKKTYKEENLWFNENAFNEFASMDINLNQFALYESQTNSSYLFDIKRLKSINWFYNKQKAKIQSKIDKCKNKLKELNNPETFYYGYIHQFLSNETIDKIKESLILSIKKLKNKLKKLTTKRNGKMNYWSHLISKLISEKLNHLKVKNLIIGKNKDLKKEVNLGSVTNQNFVQIPFNQILDKLVYKAHLKGIDVFFVEESYTSKISFFDQEKLYNEKGLKQDKPSKTYNFLGDRIRRGLFKTQQNKLINADINGALNIARKVIGSDIYHLINVDDHVWCSCPSKIRV